MSSSSDEDKSTYGPFHNFRRGSGSVDILLPDRRASIPPKRNSNSSTAKYLIYLTAVVVEHIAKHEFNHPDFREFMADNYTAYLEYKEEPITKTREEFLKTYEAFVKANPNYTLEIISITADVNEKNGSATTWMHLRVKGHPTNLWRESVTIASWTRKTGSWMSYKQTGIRNVGVDL